MTIFNRDKNINVTITTSTIIEAVLIVTAVGFLIRFVHLIVWPLRLIVISAFLAMALNPAVSWLARNLKSKSRVRATALAYLLVVTVLIAFMLIVVPPVVQQVRQFGANIPTSVSEFEDQNTAMVGFINRYGLESLYADFVEAVRGNIQNITRQAVSTVAAIGSAIVSTITVLIMTFMMLVEGPAWFKWFWRVQTNDVERKKQLAAHMYRMVTGYVNGQLIIASIAAIVAFLALIITSRIFGVTINAPALAIIVGVIGLIPMIGNTIAAAVVVLVCLFVSIPLALAMAAFFILYQQIENATFQPYVQSKYNDLTPLTVFVAAIIGVTVAGFLGALVAIPIAGCIRIYFLDYFARNIEPKTD